MSQTPPAATVRTHLTVPLRFADGYSTTARVFTFDGLVDGREHVALGLGDRAAAFSANGNGRRDSPPLVRPHSECLTGDVFGSERCDCGAQMSHAVRRIAGVGGFLLYLRQEGRGIGLYAKLDAYALQDAGMDTYEANRALGYADDERDYTVAAQMLHALGLPRVALLTNNSDKVTPSRFRRVCTCPRRTRATWRRRSATASTRSIFRPVNRRRSGWPTAPGLIRPSACSVAGALESAQ